MPDTSKFAALQFASTYIYVWEQLSVLPQDHARYVDIGIPIGKVPRWMQINPNMTAGGPSQSGQNQTVASQPDTPALSPLQLTCLTPIDCMLKAALSSVLACIA